MTASTTTGGAAVQRGRHLQLRQSWCRRCLRVLPVCSFQNKLVGLADSARERWPACSAKARFHQCRVTKAHRCTTAAWQQCCATMSSAQTMPAHRHSPKALRHGGGKQAFAITPDQNGFASALKTQTNASGTKGTLRTACGSFSATDFGFRSFQLAQARLQCC